MWFGKSVKEKREKLNLQRTSLYCSVRLDHCHLRKIGIKEYELIMKKKKKKLQSQNNLFKKLVKPPFPIPFYFQAPHDKLLPLLLLSVRRGLSLCW